MNTVEIIATKNWLAPVAKPIPIMKNKYINSSGSLIAALNLTIDNAPTKPNDSAKENLITVITKQVITANGINNSENDKNNMDGDEMCESNNYSKLEKI